MSRKTGIQWTDATWNPIRGCSRVSEGCRNCYAEVVAARFSGPGQAYAGLARRTSKGEARWTGRIMFVEKHLRDPLRWKKPARVFVNSMSDLFHERVTDEQLDRIFAIMAMAEQHTFQVLTKRPERMRDYSLARLVGLPLPNVWLGVSVEDQKAADERIPLLLKTPATIRFLSCEPLLGPVDLTAIGSFRGEKLSALEECVGHVERPRVDWVIVGGESGTRARPCNIQWVRDIVRQCRAVGVAVFVKQLGAKVQGTYEEMIGTTLRSHTFEIPLEDGHGGNPDEWFPDLRVREFPKEAARL